MRELQMGQNCPIGSGQIVVSIAGEPHEDFMARLQAGAILIGSKGRVRDEGDLISAEHSNSRDGSVAFTKAKREFRIKLDSVPATNIIIFYHEREIILVNTSLDCRLVSDLCNRVGTSQKTSSTDTHKFPDPVHPSQLNFRKS